MDKNLQKDFIWNTLGSLVNTFTSLFFMMIIIRINGVDEAGIFTFAFSTAVFFQIIGTYCGRAFQVTELNKDIKDSDYINSRYITCVAMVVVSLLFCLIKGYSRYKFLIMIILVVYKAIEAFSEVVYGIIQKNNQLDKVGKSLLLKGIFGFAILLIVDLLTKSMLFSCISLIITNLIIMIFYDLINLKNCKYEKAKFNSSIFKLGFYTFLFTFLTQYLINAPKFAIDNNLSNELQTVYGVIAMPATFMALCGQFLIQPFLIQLTNCLSKNEYKNFNKLTFKLVKYILIIGLLVIVAAYLLGIPVLQIVYGIKLKKYLFPFMLIIIGSVIYGTTTIIQNSLVALRKTKIQAIIFIIDSIIAYFISTQLVLKYELLGASLTYLICMIVLFILYLIVYIVEINKKIRGNI